MDGGQLLGLPNAYLKKWAFSPGPLISTLSSLNITLPSVQSFFFFYGVVSERRENHQSLRVCQVFTFIIPAFILITTF